MTSYELGKAILSAEGPGALRRFVMQALSSDNYATHHWIGARQDTDYGTGFEYISFCANCGCEDLGDPAEFPELAYPNCNDMAD